jgi:hypothetical protein
MDIDLTKRFNDLKELRIIVRPAPSMVNRNYGVGFRFRWVDGAPVRDVLFLHASDNAVMGAAAFEAQQFTILNYVNTVPLDILWLAGTYNKRLLGIFLKDENPMLEDLVFSNTFAETEIVSYALKEEAP